VDAPEIVGLREVASGMPFWAADDVVHTFRYQPRDFVDIALFLGGTGQHIIRARGLDEPHRHPLCRGDLAVYRPGDDVTFEAATDEGLPHRFVSVPIVEWRSLSDTAGFDSSWLTEGAPPVVPVDADDPVLLELFDTAISRIASGRPTGLDLMRFWIGIVPYLFPDPGNRAVGPAPTWLATTLEAMRDERNLRGGVARLRELAHVSAPYLATVIRRHFDSTPSGLVMRMRLRHAATLLAETGESVGAVARRCGFRSFAYFSTSFRRAHLVSPRDYRARMQGGASDLRDAF
jgi:AraC family cel operon transcriptional repressor